MKVELYDHHRHHNLIAVVDLPAVPSVGGGFIIGNEVLDVYRVDYHIPATYTPRKRIPGGWQDQTFEQTGGAFVRVYVQPPGARNC